MTKRIVVWGTGFVGKMVIAELGHRVVDRLRNLLGVGAVGLDRHYFPAVGSHLGDQLFGLGGGPAVCEGDGGAVGGEASDDFGTDAAGRAGDQRTATLEVCHSAFKLTHGAEIPACVRVSG